MKALIHHSLTEYIDALSEKVPAPGGGSAAALTGALAAALVTMVANYSIGKNGNSQVEKQIKDLRRRSEGIRKKLMTCVDSDALAYLAVVRARKGTARQKKAALKKACQVPLQIAGLCYQGVDLTPCLVRYGNRHLISDIEVAVELFFAAYKAAMINVRINTTAEGN